MPRKKKQAVTSVFFDRHSDYRKMLASIKEQVEAALYQAYRAAASAQVGLYWSIGEDIVKIQEKHEWGDAVVETLSEFYSKGAFRVEKTA